MQLKPVFWFEFLLWLVDYDNVTIFNWIDLPLLSFDAKLWIQTSKHLKEVLEGKGDRCLPNLQFAEFVEYLK